MFDIGWSELLVIGVVALIVVGPKDLPGMFRTLGRFTGKMRGMARDFQRAMDDAAKSSGMDETVRDLKTMTSKKSLGIDALESAASKFEKWDPVKKAAAPGAVASPASAVPAAATAASRPVVAVGPNTKALAEKQAAERAARATSGAEKTIAAPAAPAPKAAGRRRSAVSATPAAGAPAKPPATAAAQPAKAAPKPPAPAAEPAAAPIAKPRAKKAPKA